MHKKIRALRQNHLDISFVSSGSANQIKKKDYNSNYSAEKSVSGKTIASQKTLNKISDQKKFQILTENLTNPICQEFLHTPTANNNATLPQSII